MSHFVVVVVGPDYESQLAPYHEFECTGQDDQYVQVIDRTDEARKEYATAKETRVQLADGTLRDLYEDGNYCEDLLRDPTPEELEFKNPLSDLGADAKRTALARSIRWNSDRSKVLALPSGAKEVRVQTRETFAQWAVEYFGGVVVPYGMEPNFEEDAKYGYVQLGLSMDENGDDVKVFDRTNPNKKWDWYQVGGRWTGFFRLKPNTIGVLGEESLLAKFDPEHTPVPAGRADIVRHGDVDWDGMRAEAEYDAGVKYDAFHAILAKHPAVTPWSEVLAKFAQEAGLAIGPDGRPVRSEDLDDDDETDDDEDVGDDAPETTNEAVAVASRPTKRNFVDLARQAYHAQPAVKELTSAENIRKFGFMLDIEDYTQQTREQFIELARARAVCPYAVVKDGQWYQRGEMGWFGISTDEKDDRVWALEVAKLFDSLPPETELTAVDCHI